MNATSYFLALIVIIFFAACQAPESEGNTKVTVHLKFPQGMTPTGQRFQSFVKRANYLEIKLKSKEGYRRSTKYPPESWSEIQLPGLPFPQNEQDELSIEIGLWDKNRDDLPRRFPAFRGSAVLKSTDVDLNGAAEINVKLSQQISPNDYE